MSDFPLDELLNIMLAIFAGLLLIIPMLYDGLQNKTEIRDKKGKLLSIKLSGINKRGIFFIVIFILSLGTGIWKAIRDDNSKQISKNSERDLNNTITDLTLKVDTFRKNWIGQYTTDTEKFGKLVRSLNKRHLGVDKDLNITNVYDSNSTSVVSIIGSYMPGAKIYDNNMIIGNPPDSLYRLGKKKIPKK